VRKMSAKHVLIVALLIAVTCACANYSRPARAVANVVVASSSSYRDTLNDYWVFGEVKNTGNTPATNISITTSFYDASSNFVNSSTTTIEGSYGSGKFIVLHPGAKAPFYMLLLPQSGTVNFDHYGFAVSFEECVGKAAGFQIPFSQCVRYTAGPTENVNVTGVIENTMPTPIQDWFNFYATVYDSAGKVIGRGYLYRQENLLPGEVAAFSFQVATFYPAQTANFTVTAQSTEWAIENEYNGIIVPEFSSLFAILPLMAATTILVLCKKDARPRAHYV
jgi:hypothetical protein